jgi:FemAB-related protein (PEP-CTERM system-associated)
VTNTDTHIRRLDATQLGEECRRLRATPGATLAHQPEWCEVIASAYHHEPLYLAGEDDKGRRGLLPAFIIRRPIAGMVVTSMPFLDSGGPAAPSLALRRALVAALLEHARRAGARLVELRGVDRLDGAGPAREDKVNLTLPLPADPEAFWRSLDKSVRNQVRKAERSGLSVERGGAELIPPFYGIFAARMRDLGSPVHARAFFGAIFDAFRDRARLLLVRKGATPIGGLVGLTFDRTMAVPWAACRQEYFGLCPNMLLYWETLRGAMADGVTRFEFGRSTRGSGTYRFKRQWGAEEQPLFWYSLSPGAGHRQPALPSTNHGRSILAGSWRRLPLAITRQLGPVIRRYLTQ